ncbi:hypothetical protein T4D_612 [Trichinella pseudospiralis]|uniref:Uncharacterized protein n=1 Tax=Trichinella pseudospiralis TaxID=6337 RepID=A0A0V1FC09_TRIPS|nr:hypothetical protein T4D_612 [Trichinella pseudospiralis]
MNRLLTLTSQRVYAYHVYRIWVCIFCYAPPSILLSFSGDIFANEEKNCHEVGIRLLLAENFNFASGVILQDKSVMRMLFASEESSKFKPSKVTKI